MNGRKFTGKGDYRDNSVLLPAAGGCDGGCSVRAVLVENESGTTTAIEGVADNAISTQRGGKKVIQGGKLIIIGNNGKKYNTVGIEIKK